MQNKTRKISSSDFDTDAFILDPEDYSRYDDHNYVADEEYNAPRLERFIFEKKKRSRG